MADVKTPSSPQNEGAAEADVQSPPSSPSNTNTTPALERNSHESRGKEQQVEEHEEEGDGDGEEENEEDGGDESPEERKKLEQELLEKQSTLLALLTRIETVKSEHDKLDGENKFLQSYIGELMSTSKIISTGAAKGGKGGKGR